MRSHQLEKIRKQSEPLFYTDVCLESLALGLGVNYKTLRGWWVSAFGKEIVQQRGRFRILLSNQRRGLPEGQVRLCKCGGVCGSGSYECSVCTNANHRIYRVRYPEKLLVTLAKQRSKRYGVPFNITAEYIKSCVPSDGCCPVTLQPFECGAGKVGPRSMTLDRIIPELGYIPGNILVVSHLANTIKSNCTDPVIFLRVSKYVELAKVSTSSVLKFLSNAVVIRSYYPTNYYYAKRPEIRMAKNAWKRAKEQGVPFGITEKYIKSCFPADGCCPITRQPFVKGDGKCGPQSMSLDRIVPELGYIPGNIAVISHLANTIKQNCTDPEVFRRIADYIESAQKHPQKG